MSVIAYEAIDLSSIFQMVVVFKYVLPNGTHVERFWAFHNPASHDPASMAKTINEVLQKVLDNN